MRRNAFAVCGLIHQFTGEVGFRFRFRLSGAPNCRECAGCVVDSHMFEHVSRRLDGTLTNLVHADGITAIVTYHKSATCNLSSRDVHALSLLFNNGFAPRGGWRTEPFVTMVLFRAGVRSNQRKRSVRQRLIPTVEVCTS